MCSRMSKIGAALHLETLPFSQAVSIARVAERWGVPANAPDLPEWRGPVAQRWTPVGTFSVEGSDFMVVKRNPSPTATTLTPREKLTARLAGEGLANKEIAAQLGIATGTVGVLVGRALRKLGVRRRELRALLDTKLA